eukprot:m.475201 g.475201  ORF g.475201 m.475201 type:complete len:530 (-) comp57140_c0_seq36:65-1654(-)
MECPPIERVLVTAIASSCARVSRTILTWTPSLRPVRSEIPSLTLARLIQVCYVLCTFCRRLDSCCLKSICASVHLAARSAGPAKGGLKLQNPSSNNQSEVDGAQVVMRKTLLRKKGPPQKLGSLDRGSDDFGALAEETRTNSIAESDSPLNSTRQSPTGSPQGFARKHQSRTLAMEPERQSSMTDSDSNALDDDPSDDMAVVNAALEQLQSESPSLVRHRMSQLADAIQIPIAISSASTLSKPSSRQVSGVQPATASRQRSESGEKLAANSLSATPAFGSRLRSVSNERSNSSALSTPTVGSRLRAVSGESTPTPQVPALQPAPLRPSGLSQAPASSSLTAASPPSTPPSVRAFDSASAAQTSLIIAPSSIPPVRQPAVQPAPAATAPTTTSAASAPRVVAPATNRLQGVRTLTIAERRQQQLKQQQAQGPTASTPSQPAQPVSSATKSPPSVAESTRTTKAGETNSLLDDIASSFADHEPDDLDSLRAISLSNAEPGSRQGRLSVSRSLRRHGNATHSLVGNEGGSVL